MLSLFSQVDVGHRALDYHLERHNVLASNVANVDTPGFHPLELVRETTGTRAGSLALTGTEEGHIGTASSVEVDHFRVAEEQVVNPGNDDNAVSLERELSKLGANHLRYETAARVVQTQLAQLRYAANDAQGG